MNTEQKRYLLVFTGLFLMILGGLLYIKTYKKSAKEIKKDQIRSYIIANKENKPENIFVPFNKPTKVNFVYDDIHFKRKLPVSAGLKEYRNDRYLNNAKVVCNGKNCKRQALVSKNAKVIKIRKSGKNVNVIDGMFCLQRVI